MTPDGAAQSDEPRARQTYAKTIDPRLLQQLEHRFDTQLVQSYEVRTYAREPALHVEPERWNIGFLNVREYSIPYELEQDLHEMTPQALLRDLYRPVRDLSWVEREVLVHLDWGGRLGLSEARVMRRLDSRPTIEPASTWVEQEQLRHRALVWNRWEPRLRDDQERHSVTVMTEPSFRL